MKNGALFHVRIRVAADQPVSLTEANLSAKLRQAAKRYHELGHWWCELFLLMPNHVHALLRFPRDLGMAAVVGNWKRGTARFQGVKWQENFFDHRIRDQAEADEKWHYTSVPNDLDYRLDYGGSPPYRRCRVKSNYQGTLVLHPAKSGGEADVRQRRGLAALLDPNEGGTR